MAATNISGSETDAQVDAMNSFPVRPSLLDYITNKYNVAQHDPANPFTMRVILCGPSPTIKDNDTQADGIFFSDSSNKNRPLTILEKISNESCASADADNPYIDKNVVNAEKSSGIIIDYGEFFVHLLEGYEDHVYKYIETLAKDKEMSEKAFILFVDDDVQNVVPPGWILTNKIPTDSADTAIKTKLSDDELADVVAEDVNKLIEFASEAKRYAGGTAGGTPSADNVARYHIHADNGLGEFIRRTFPKLFPLYTNISMYIKSGLFLSLGDFVEEFSSFPLLNDDEEVVYPAEEIIEY